MSYTFQRENSIYTNLQQVITEQIETARSALTNPQDVHEGIHTARKCFKKVRGALRLGRPALGDVYQQENRRFRDAGRALSQIRDAEAMIEIVDKLGDQYPEQTDRSGFRLLRKTLGERRHHILHDQSNLEQRIQGVIAELDAAQQALQSWPGVEEVAAPGAGLKKTYKRGRNAMHRAYHHPTPEAFHDWRKRVKYSWYHSRLLQGVWSPVMKSYRNQFKGLSKLLGDDHDLAVLVETIGTLPDMLPEDHDRHALIEVVEQQQEYLRNHAWFHGQRLYALRPRIVAGSIEHFWHIWQQEPAHAMQ
jgi:CHAD domain-containing protein